MGWTALPLCWTWTPVASFDPVSAGKRKEKMVYLNKPINKLSKVLRMFSCLFDSTRRQHNQTLEPRASRSSGGSISAISVGSSVSSRGFLWGRTRVCVCVQEVYIVTRLKGRWRSECCCCCFDVLSEFDRMYFIVPSSWFHVCWRLKEWTSPPSPDPSSLCFWYFVN